MSIFREYDIRGIFEKELNRESVSKIGYRLGREIVARTGGEAYVAVGYDARLHSPALRDWLCSGLNAGGCRVLELGMVPTPVTYFAHYQTIGSMTDGELPEEVKERSPDAAVMITGSHNPPEYNGFKITVGREPFFGEAITRLGEEVARCEEEIPDRPEALPVRAKERYVDYMLREFSSLELKGKRFLFDCGNGAAGVVLRQILEGLGIEYEILFEKPDGTFPNHHPDPSDVSTLATLRERLASGVYDLGFAYDGDADRLAVLSSRHNFKGDILAIFFSKFMENPVIIGEVKCSQIMYDTIDTYGRAIMYKTGHSNLKVKIRETGAAMAAEVSGHLFFNDRYYGYDDAIYATLRVLELQDRGFDFDEEYENLPPLYTTEEINLDTTEEEKFLLVENLKERLKTPPPDFPTIRRVIGVDGVRVVFEEGWGLIRASNTTPRLVTRFEAKDEETALRYQKAMLDLLNGKD